MFDGYSAIDFIVVIALCASSAFLSNIGAAVFHDGIRPVIPEFIEGRMKRPELASIAFGLSVGFIASVGIAFTISTKLLNPWLLFLSTDILGIIAPKKWLAPIFGGIWGALCLSSLGMINTALTSLPVDMITGLGALGDPVIAGFSLFPLIAIFRQFGAKKGIISTVVTLLVRQIVVITIPNMTDVLQMLTGIVILIGLAIFTDVKAKKEQKETGVVEESENIFTQRINRIKKNLPFLMITGGLIAVACNIGVFAGSEVSIYTLADAYKSVDPSTTSELVNQAALAETMRSLGFIPLIATTAITTGVYGVAGLCFVYPIGYLMPNPILALIAGAAVIFIEVMVLGLIGKGFEKLPSIKDASDSIRSSMITAMEFALLIGSVNASIQMGGTTGFFICAMVYFINELTGTKIMKMAIGPVGAIVTGILLNLLHIVGLFPLL